MDNNKKVYVSSWLHPPGQNRIMMLPSPPPAYLNTPSVSFGWCPTGSVPCSPSNYYSPNWVSRMNLQEMPNVMSPPRLNLDQGFSAASGDHHYQQAPNFNLMQQMGSSPGSSSSSSLDSKSRNDPQYSRVASLNELLSTRPSLPPTQQEIKRQQDSFSSSRKKLEEFDEEGQQQDEEDEDGETQTVSSAGGNSNIQNMKDLEISEQKQHDDIMRNSRSYPHPLLKTSPSHAKGKRLEIFNGHRRLSIQFICIGNLGKYPQTCGNGNQVLIPECLSGFYTAYHQRWKFEISQSSPMFTKNGKKCICFKWAITNVTTQTSHAITETPNQAYIRMSHGRTIASKVFRNAMLAEAEEMEQTLIGEKDPSRISNVTLLLKALRPKTFSEGLLFFGLKHECVQKKMTQMLIAQT
jgi:hypothetical protein